MHYQHHIYTPSVLHTINSQRAASPHLNIKDESDAIRACYPLLDDCLALLQRRFSGMAFMLINTYNRCNKLSDGSLCLQIYQETFAYARECSDQQQVALHALSTSGAELKLDDAEYMFLQQAKKERRLNASRYPVQPWLGWHAIFTLADNQIRLKAFEFCHTAHSRVDWHDVDIIFTLTHEPKSQVSGHTILYHHYTSYSSQPENICAKSSREKQRYSSYRQTSCRNNGRTERVGFCRESATAYDVVKPQGGKNADFSLNPSTAYSDQKKTEGDNRQQRAPGDDEKYEVPDADMRKTQVDHDATDKEYNTETNAGNCFQVPFRGSSEIFTSVFNPKILWHYLWGPYMVLRQSVTKHGDKWLIWIHGCHQLCLRIQNAVHRTLISCKQWVSTWQYLIMAATMAMLTTSYLGCFCVFLVALGYMPILWRSLKTSIINDVINRVSYPFYTMGSLKSDILHWQSSWLLDRSLPVSSMACFKVSMRRIFTCTNLRHVK